MARMSRYFWTSRQNEIQAMSRDILSLDILLPGREFFGSRGAALKGHPIGLA